MNTIKIILVDYHSIVRDGLKNILMNLPEIEVVGEAASEIEFYKLLKIIKPDIVLMDIMSPTMTGITITERLSIEYPAIKVIILTSEIDKETKLKALKSGALAYIPKDIDYDKLIESIKIVNEVNKNIEISIFENL